MLIVVLIQTLPFQVVLLTRLHNNILLLCSLIIQYKCSFF
nr:MAG TPA: Integrin alpha-1 Alpha1, Transmembrane Region, Detergent [Caudoviricetes sp.]